MAHIKTEAKEYEGEEEVCKHHGSCFMFSHLHYHGNRHEAYSENKPCLHRITVWKYFHCMFRVADMQHKSRTRRQK